MKSRQEYIDLMKKHYIEGNFDKKMAFIEYLSDAKEILEFCLIASPTKNYTNKLHIRIKWLIEEIRSLNGKDSN